MRPGPRPPSERLVEDESTPWRRLACAVLLQAVQDTSARPWREQWGPGSPSEARRWLRSPEGAGLAEALDLDAGLQRWLQRQS